MSEEKKDQEVKKTEKKEKAPKQEVAKTEPAEEKAAKEKTSKETSSEKAEKGQEGSAPTPTSDDTTTNKKEGGAVPKIIYPDAKAGASVRIHEKIKEKKGKEEKERIQIFEGLVLARKHGNEPGATITVRKIAKGGFGVEKIYPLHSPLIAKIDVVKQAIVKQAKIGFVRNYKKKLKYKK
jgi:large subunit ribosomal protein L19